MQMRTILSTMECLFALINGDDMFATFANLSPQVRLPALFGIFLHLYVYLFVSLFTYVVLQLALSIIIDTAKELKEVRCPFPAYSEKVISDHADQFRRAISLDWIALASLVVVRASRQLVSCLFIHPFKQSFIFVN